MINLHLATGQIGKPGAGPFSLTGQPNAMGGREVGGLANLLSAHRDLSNPTHRAEVAALWGVPSVPDKPGKTAVEMFQAAADGEIKALWIACTNPAQSMPDQATVRRALERAELVIVQEAFATTATCAYADLLLPATTWGEKEGTVTNSERRISRVRAAVPAPAQTRHDWQIVVDIAQRMESLQNRNRSLFPYGDPESIWNEHRESTRGRDLDITGLSYALLEQAPQQWPCPTDPAQGDWVAGGSAQVKEEPAKRAGDTEQSSASALAPNRPLFVIEADEYDTAFFDKRSKFVHYRPRTAILNNLEFDHADIFDNLAAIERQFHHLVRTVPSTGRVVVNDLEESLTRVLHQGCWSEVRSFGAAVSDFTAVGEPHDFEVCLRGKPVGQVIWALSGVHNQLNALAAIAAAEHVGVAPDVAAKALGTFENVKRRMEVRALVQLPGTASGKATGQELPITIYDDFAHHPTAIRTTVNGLRRKVRTARILAVFEPRSNTMKLGAMKAQLPWSLEEADLAFCHSGGLGWDATAALAPMGARAQVADTVDAVVAQVLAAARAGDHVLCMSNGGFGGIHAKLEKALLNR